MEGVATNVDAVHLGLADFDTFLVGPGIECAFDLEPGLRRGGGDQLNHGGTIGKRSASPVLRDVTKHPVLDPAAFPVDHHHARCRPLLQGMGGDQFFGEIVVEVSGRQAHSRSLSPDHRRGSTFY